MKKIVALSLIVLSAACFAEDKPAGESAEKRDAELLSSAKKADVIKAGKATYVGLCQSCHGEIGKTTGDAPTNLFDAKWYHGGKPHEIEHTILEGVIEKGMPGWGAALPAEDTAAVAAFLLSFQK